MRIVVAIRMWDSTGKGSSALIEISEQELRAFAEEKAKQQFECESAQSKEIEFIHTV